ncbi:MAG: C40 family peptidase [Clostridia bacterium]|nr:C40 family peptidase [Clostridia bacterium]
MFNVRKLLAITVVFVIILSTVSLSVSAETTSYGLVTADLLNLRETMSTSARILAQIPNGQSVPIYGFGDGWAAVTYNGCYGFVSMDFLKVMPGSMPNRSAAVTSKGQSVVELAKKYLGVPYVYGGSSPSGFDCSGFVYYIYKQMGVTLNRVAHDQMANGTPVAKENLLPGDIVCFSRGNGYVHHVGIYAGNGMMIHAPQTGDVVKYESIVTGGYANRYYCARRIFN